MKRAVDVIIFNPPYVPTNMDEARNAQYACDIQSSWAGGSDGMNITDQFLDLVEVWNASGTLQACLTAH